MQLVQPKISEEIEEVSVLRKCALTNYRKKWVVSLQNIKEPSVSYFSVDLENLQASNYPQFGMLNFSLMNSDHASIVFCRTGSTKSQGDGIGLYINMSNNRTCHRWQITY